MNNHYEVKVLGSEAVFDQNTGIINWVIGDMAENKTKTISYTLTPTQVEGILVQDRFEVADSFIVTHNSGLQEIKFEQYPDGRDCIPYVKVVEASTEKNPNTGISTNILISGSIIIISSSIFYLTSKKTKFSKI